LEALAVPGGSCRYKRATLSSTLDFAVRRG